MCAERLISWTELVVTEEGENVEDLSQLPLDLSTTWVHLTYKSIKTLLPAWGRLTKVTNLFLVGNCLETLPDAIGELANLQSLNLTGNRIHSLPPTFAKLTKIRALSLSSNSLNVVPNALKRLPALHLLALADNPFHETIVFPESWSSLKSLLICGCNQRTVSPTIANLKGLEMLSMARNKMHVLPQLKALGRLKSLVISENPIGALPMQLINLRCLEILKCNDCGLRQIPEWLGGQLKTLGRLEMNNNHLMELPLSIGRFQELSTLSLNGNQLTHVPKALAGCQKLIFLDVSNNQIESFPIALYDHNPYLKLYADGVTSLVPKQGNNHPKHSRAVMRLDVQAARKLARHKSRLTRPDLPEPCLDLINSTKECSTLSCTGTFVKGSGIDEWQIVGFGNQEILPYHRTMVRVVKQTCHPLCSDKFRMHRK